MREAATALVRRRSQHTWVGYDQGVAMQETTGQDVAVAIYVAMRLSNNNPTAADEQP